ncbi:MAG: flavodoxin family protein [Chitinispirillaceae bacterium]|nr:flavodoxin family protein [Chitinispirillaceae bacterium]
MKIIGVNGSPHRDGNTALLLRTVLETIENEGISTELILVGGTAIRGCTACYQCGKNKNRQCTMKDDGFNEIFRKLDEADGFLLGSPTYFADITPEMKALIDRAGFVSRANGQLFRHKAGAAVVAVRRAGGMHAFDSINHLFQICGMFTVGSSYWNIGFGRKQGEAAQDAEGMTTMQDLGRSMAFLVKKLHT